jgi:hypothetical protein
MMVVKPFAVGCLRRRGRGFLGPDCEDEWSDRANGEVDIGEQRCGQNDLETADVIFNPERAPHQGHFG